jgi:hypothetical protein
MGIIIVSSQLRDELGRSIKMNERQNYGNFLRHDHGTRCERRHVMEYNDIDVWSEDEYVRFETECLRGFNEQKWT